MRKIILLLLIILYGFLVFSFAAIFFSRAYGSEGWLGGVCRDSCMCCRENSYKLNIWGNNTLFKEEIRIYNAEHLDSNKNFIRNIYREVNVIDDKTYEIPDGEYIRVYFEKNLSWGNMIDIFVKNSSGSILVYGRDSDVVLGRVEGVYGGDYYIRLDGRGYVFDLKSVGRIDYDYVHDAGPLIDNGLSANVSVIYEGEGYMRVNTTYTNNDGSNGVTSMFIQLNATYSSGSFMLNGSCGQSRPFRITSITCNAGAGGSCSGNVTTGIISFTNVKKSTSTGANIWNMQACAGATVNSPYTIYNIQVSGTDSSNLFDFTQSVTVRERVAPVVTITNPENITYTTASIPFNFSINESGTCKFSMNGGVTNYTMTANASATGFNATNYSMTDGSYTVNAYCNDTSGNNNYTTFRIFSKDTVFPNVSIVNPLAGNYSASSVTFNISLNEAGTCRYSLNGGVTNYTMTANASGTGFNATNSSIGDGQYNVRAYCNDSAGNLNVSVYTGFGIDTRFPNATIIGPTNTTYTYNTSISVNYTASDLNLQACWYSVDGEANVSITCGINSSINVSQGSHTLRLYVNDSAGNLNDSRSVTFSVDSIFPLVSIVNPQAKNYSASSLQLNFSLNEAGTCRYSLNGGVTNYTMTANASGTGFNATNSSIGDGQYTVRAYCNDSAGNLNLSVSGGFGIDSVFPVINFAGLTPNSGDNLSLSSIVFNISVTELNIDRALLQIQGRDIGNYSMSCAGSGANYHCNYTNSSIGDGRYNFTAWVNDSAGNINKSETRSVLVDTVFPLVEYGSGMEVDGVNLSRDWVYVNVSVNDTNEKNITFRLYNLSGDVNVTTYENAVRDINWTGIADGDYWYNVSVADVVNHRNTTISRKITIDRTAPNGTLIAPGNGSYLDNATQNLSFNISDNIGMKNFTLFVYNSSNVLINETTQSAYGVQAIAEIFYTFLYDGVFKWFYRIVDLAGNAFITGNNTVTVDTLKPGVYFGDGTEDSGKNFTRNWIYVNVSVTELNEANITFLLINSAGNANVTLLGAGNRSFNWTGLADGNYWYNVSVYDRANNINFTGTRKIGLDNTGPSITIIRPAAKAYTYNVSIPLNYTISDNLVGVGSCWWNLDGEENRSITCGQNTSFNTSEGQHTLYFYANDSLNNPGNSSVTFMVVVSGISVNLIAPDDNAYINYSTNIEFNYSAGDPKGVDTCILYGNWSGNWEENQTDKSIENYSGNYFYASISDGTYMWNVLCNNTNYTDNSAVFAQNNYVFSIDTTNPGIDYGFGVENDSSNFSRSWIYVNVSVAERNELNITFRLYNLSGDVNVTAYTTAIRDINWTGIADGDYWYNVSVVDRVGHVNFTGTRRIGLDTNAPLVGIIAPISGNYSVTSMSFNVSLNEIGSCKYSLNGGAANYTMSANLSMTGFNATNSSVGDGQYTVSFYCNDSIGNVNYSVSNGFGIDTVRPLLTIVRPQNITYNTTALEINYTASDNNLQACWWSNNSGLINYSIACGQNTTYTAAQGSTTIWIYANDSAGNINDSRSVTFSVDSVFPLISFIFYTPSNNSYSGGNSLPINVSLDEINFANITYELYNSTNGRTLVNRSVYLDRVLFINWTGLADGAYYYNASVIDIAGNWNSTETRAYTVDTIIPGIDYGTGVENDGGNFSRNWIYVNVSVAESNEANITFTLYNLTGSVNVTTLGALNRTINWSGISDGVYYYNVSVVDKVNHINFTATRRIGLDTTAPNGTLLSPVNNTYVNNATQNLSVNASDVFWLANVSLNVWNETALVNRTSVAVSGVRTVVGIVYTFLYSGVFKWFYQIVDIAGNIFIAGNNTIVVDLIAPNWSGQNQTVNGVDASIVHRGDVANLSIIWGDNIGLNTAWLSTNESGVWENKSDYISPQGISGLSNTSMFNWTNNSVPVGQRVYWMIYANDSAGNLNFSNQMFFTIWGWSEVTNAYINPAGVGSGQKATMYCMVRDNVSQTGVSNYPVSFYNSTSFMGSNLTGSDGYARLTFNATGAGSYVFTCNITHNASLYYNSSDINQSQATLGIGYGYSIYDYTNTTYNRAYEGTTQDNKTFIDEPYSYIVSDNGINQTFRAGSNLYAYSRFEFRLNENANAITKINITWNGYGTAGGTNAKGFNLSVYNVTGDRWMQVVANTSASERKEYIVYTGGFNNLINETGYLKILAQSYAPGASSGGSGDRWVEIGTDYISVQVYSDILVPTVSLLKPVEGYNTSSIDIRFNCSVSDDNSVKNVSLFGNWSGGWHANETNSSGINNVNYSFNKNISDGNYIWNCLACDNAGNCGSQSIDNTIRIDTTPPSVNLFYPVGGQNLSDLSIIQFNFSTSDASPIVNCSLYGNWSNGWLLNQTMQNPQKNTVINFSGVNAGADGYYKWNVGCTDDVNNFGVNNTNFTFLIDTTNPLIDYGYGVENDGVNVSRNWIYINVSVVENYEGNITFRLYNLSGDVNVTEYMTRVRTINWTGISDGSYWYNVSIADVVNHRNTTVSRKITLDTTAPNGTLLTPGNNSYVNNATQNLTVNASDNILLKNVTLFVYNSTNELINQTTQSASGVQAFLGVVYTFLYDGLFKWFYQIVDIAGNVFIAGNNTITIDRVNPQVDYGYGVEDDGSNVSRNWIYVNVSVAELNEANITFRLYNLSGDVNMTTLGALNRTINWTGLEDGIYYYNVSVVDKAGNSNITSSRRITLDTTPPLVSIITPLNRTYNTSRIGFNISLNEPAGKCIFSVNNWADNYSMTAYNLTYYNYTNSSFLRGNYTARFWCNDSAGNINLSAQVNFSVMGWLVKNLSSSFQVVDAAGGSDEFSSQVQLGVVSTLVKKNGVLLGSMDINFSQDLNWIDVSAGNGSYYEYDVLLGKSYLHIPPVNHSEISNVRLYIPALGDPGLAYVCPNVSSLEDINESCPGLYYDSSVANVSGYYNVTINGTGSAQTAKSRLLIWDSNDSEGGGRFIYQFQQANFYANFTDKVTNKPINGSGVYCNITFNFSGWTPWTNMSFNGTSRLYEYNRNFTLGGIYRWNVTCDGDAQKQGIIATNDTITIANDTTIPNGTLLGPANNSYLNNRTQNLILNASDNVGLSNVTLFVFNSTNSLVNQTTISVSGLQAVLGIVYTFLYDGVFKWFYRIADLAGNAFNTENYTVTIDTVNPGISIIYPQNISYNVNVIVLNYTIADINPEKCWYTLNNGQSNTTINCGDNVTGLNANEGNNTWIIYANDSAGNLNFSSVAFFVDTIAPKINLLYPGNWINLSYLAVQFNYSVNDTNALSNCSLYGNWSGGWGINVSVNGISNNGSIVQNFSDVNMVNDGYYIWNIECVDAYGNVGRNSSNFTFAAFLFPNAPAAFNISQSSNDGRGNITLFWNSGNHSFKYRVYYADLLNTSFVLLNETSWLNYTDAGFAGNKRRFYMVETWNPTGQNASTQVYGVHVYSLRRKEGGNTRNWIGFPTNFSYLKTANDTLREITNATALNMWNETIQKRVTCNWYSCPDPMTCTETNCNWNFSMLIGRGYEVNINGSTPLEVNWSGVGLVFNAADIGMVKNETNFGKNWISIYANTSIRNASGILRNISNSDAVTRWDAAAQISRGLIPSPFQPGQYLGTNFNVVMEEGYEVSVNNSVTWRQT